MLWFIAAYFYLLSEMNEILNQLLTEYNSNRVILALIHPTGLKEFTSYLYVFSVKYEVFKDLNSFSVQSFLQNKPISILVQEASNYEKGILFVSSETADLPLLCINHLKRLKCTTIINLYIYYKEAVIGILSFQYKSINDCPFKSKEECINNSNKLDKTRQLVTNQLLNIL